MLQRTYEKYRLLDARTSNMNSSSNVINVQNDENETEEKKRDTDMSCYAHDNIQGKYSCQSIRKRHKSKLRVTELLKESFEKFSNIDKVGSTNERIGSLPKTNVKKIAKAKTDPNNYKNSKLLMDLSMKSKRCTAVKRFSKISVTR